jgi:hypothetical protein
VVVVVGRVVVVDAVATVVVVALLREVLVELVVVGSVVVDEPPDSVVGVVGSVGVLVTGPNDDWPPPATGTCTGMPTARSATRPTAWEATPTARAVARNQAARRPNRFFITRALSALPG